MELKPIWDKYVRPHKQRLIACLAIVLVLALAILVFVSQQRSHDEAMLRMLSDNQELHSEITVTKNRHQSTVKAIKTLTDKNTQLIELVASLQKKASRPPVIREVVVVETQVIAQAPFSTDVLPIEHKFKLDVGLEVASFHSGPPYLFTTHDLHVRNSVVIGTNESAALLQIASSAEPDHWYEIPVDEFTVSHVDPEHKLFRPDLALSLRAGLSAQPQLTAALNLTFLHPTPCIDSVGIVAAGNTQTMQFGVIPFSYNIGCHIPIVKDLWVITDAYVDIRAQFGGGIAIGTKF
jgi:hypothetical protein